jgi:GT2 family glycosyltransferase
MSKKLGEKPLVSIVVLNWNGQRYNDIFFKSVAKQTYGTKKIEAIFVDNGSSDDSVKKFLEMKIPYAKLIETGDNYGYSGGNNFGIREAKGDYIVICNNDLVLEPKWLETLVKTAQETDADIVVPKLIHFGTSKIYNAGSMIHPEDDWPNRERGVNQSADKKEFNTRAEITAFCGASPLFKRSFLEEVGLFDKQFFLYWEDTDLSWRGQKLGKKIYL